MTDFRRLLRLLSDAKIEFIVVGGAAATAHGAPRLTMDLDLVYRRTPENLKRIAAAFAPYDPYPRGAPRGLPFQWDARTLQFGTNFTLTTTLGQVDLLGEITGGGAYDQLLPRCVWLELYDTRCLCLDLETLIHTKNAAGRPKDYEAIAELEVIREEKAKRTDPSDH
jgi:hypothetical protein